MIKVLLADDQWLFRKGIASLLSLEEDLHIVGQASDGHEAVAMAGKLQPDVILMDVRMPVCDGVAATREIHLRFPWIRVLVLTTFDEDELIWHSLQAGALGYLLKSTAAAQIATAIRNLAQGYGQLGPTIAERVFAQLPAPTPKKSDWRHLLSERELDVLRLIAQGSNNREISQTLHLSEGTVKNHVTRIFCQLGVRDRTQAALWAQQHLL